MSEFDSFFTAASESPTAPFPFQRRFAHELPSLVRVPTGLGKTAMAVIGWLWRRHGAPDAIKTDTPRRLVYCLPMRVLVEQTRDNAQRWIDNLHAKRLLPERVAVHVLMGGEKEDDWDIYPERDAILIGTQEMLLSRALNRGYASSRSRWPMQFGLLHTDCLWVFDEIQLMGAGLATTAQLEAFRHVLGNKDGHGCRSMWMSATMDRDWLRTVDFNSHVDGLPLLELDTKDHQDEEIGKRWRATKTLHTVEAPMGDTLALASTILKQHRPSTRTIVVVNTVWRARELFEALGRFASERPKAGKAPKKEQTLQPNLVLLHSRFRPSDREKAVKRALATPPPEGTIVVSTQVIEAGVDVSATTLFTELAPWASLVQRFGRCNRKGEDKNAQVFWVDLPPDKSKRQEIAAPYEFEAVEHGGKKLTELGDVGLKSLPNTPLTCEHNHVIRRKDLVDLFDTTPDLAGNDIDIDRFVREVEESDVRVFWRNWLQQNGQEPPPEDAEAPQRDELCTAPIGSDKNPGFRQFAKSHSGKVWRWNFLQERWERADVSTTAPGQIFLIHADAGGYDPVRGWDAASEGRVEPIQLAGDHGRSPDANEADAPSRIAVWQRIDQHADEVCVVLDDILKALFAGTGEDKALHHAARWHDRGKAHEVFQNAIDDGQVVDRNGRMIQRRDRPDKWRGCRFLAKAPDKRRANGNTVVDHGFWRRYERKHFRHELASALAVLDPGNGRVPDEHRDLVAYLVAAHHGKVRMSIRSLPDERRPDSKSDGKGAACRFARGIWEGDALPEVNLGDGVIAPAVTLSLEPMELGLCEQGTFAGQPSWAERMLHLRDSIGPFRLAFLEAVLRAADWRASARAKEPDHA